MTLNPIDAYTRQKNNKMKHSLDIKTGSCLKEKELLCPSCQYSLEFDQNRSTFFCKQCSFKRSDFFCHACNSYHSPSFLYAHSKEEKKYLEQSRKFKSELPILLSYFIVLSSILKVYFHY
jgi:predicted amidophosphoribosyltransferase